MSLNIDLRLHRAAVALAEELNYHRASKRIHISQSALTKQIRELEDELGFPLFERDKRHVVLLETGRAFVENAKLALSHSDRAIYMARAASVGASRSVVVGRSPYTSSELTAKLFTVRLSSAPRLNVRLESSFAPQLVQGVCEGSLDLAIVTAVPETDEVVQFPIRRTRLQVAISSRHPAAGKDLISLSDVSDTCWALFAKPFHPWIYDSLMKTAHERQIAVPEIQHVITVAEGYRLAADRQCASFVTEYGEQSVTKTDVVVKELHDDGLQFTTSLLIRADRPSETASRFARAYLRKATKPSR